VSVEQNMLGTCRHTKRKHGWWCLRCLKRAAPAGVEMKMDSEWWEVDIGPVEGFGGTRVEAWQAAIKRAEMDGVSLTEVSP